MVCASTLFSLGDYSAFDSRRTYAEVGTVERHVAEARHPQAKARARNILQGAKPGQATASTEGASARLGFDALGTQKPVPGRFNFLTNWKALTRGVAIRYS